jgi:hypothetical protein
VGSWVVGTGEFADTTRLRRHRSGHSPVEPRLGHAKRLPNVLEPRTRVVSGRRGPNVNWFVLLGLFLPVMVVAVLIAFYPSGVGAFIIVGVFAVYVVTLPVVGIVYLVRKDRRETRRRLGGEHSP